MSIGINDVFTFGKFKGKTFADVMANEPDGANWCCWLREEKKKSGQPRAFDKEANDVIDVAIRSSKTLRKKYQVWNATEQDLQEITKRQVEAQEQREVADQQRDMAYAGEWGAW
jgi:hypothetical protein